MKNIFLFGLIFSLLISCAQNKTKDYFSLIGTNISSTEMQEFLKGLGTEYETNEYNDRVSYIYDNKGVELSFDKNQNLKAIFFKIEKLEDEFVLPLNIKSTFTRSEIIEKFGKSDRDFIGLRNLSSYYIDNNLVVKFKYRDTLNLNNPIAIISIQKLNREKVMK